VEGSFWEEALNLLSDRLLDDYDDDGDVYIAELAGLLRWPSFWRVFESGSEIIAIMR
jgi:hypothetical protein